MDKSAEMSVNLRHLNQGVRQTECSPAGGRKAEGRGGGSQAQSAVSAGWGHTATGGEPGKERTNKLGFPGVIGVLPRVGNFQC